MGAAAERLSQILFSPKINKTGKVIKKGPCYGTCLLSITRAQCSLTVSVNVRGAAAMCLAARPAHRVHGAPAGAHRVPSCWPGPGSLPPSPHTSAALHKARARTVCCLMCCEMQRHQEQCAGMAVSSEESFPARPKYFVGIILPLPGFVFHRKETIPHDSNTLNVPNSLGLIFNITKYCTFAVLCNISPHPLKQASSKSHISCSS